MVWTTPSLRRVPGRSNSYDIKDGILLFDVAVQVFYSFLRIAFDYRIGTFPDLFMLPVEDHFEKITFLHAFYVPVTHPGDAVLGESQSTTPTFKPFW